MIIERIERWRALQQPMCHAVRYEQLAKSRGEGDAFISGGGVDPGDRGGIVIVIS